MPEERNKSKDDGKEGGDHKPIPFDDALRKLLSTPPQPRTSKGDKPKEKKPPDD